MRMYVHMFIVQTPLGAIYGSSKYLSCPVSLGQQSLHTLSFPEDESLRCPKPIKCWTHGGQRWTQDTVELAERASAGLPLTPSYCICIADSYSICIAARCSICNYSTLYLWYLALPPPLPEHNAVDLAEVIPCSVIRNIGSSVSPIAPRGPRRPPRFQCTTQVPDCGPDQKYSCSENEIREPVIRCYASLCNCMSPLSNLLASWSHLTISQLSPLFTNREQGCWNWSHLQHCAQSGIFPNKRDIKQKDASNSMVEA